MSCAFPAPGPITALASSGLYQLRGVELSIVSILNGELGDPVTWIDEADDSQANCAAPCRPAPFGAAAEDIAAAHLPAGPVVIHRPDPGLTLLRQVLPVWQSALGVDVASLPVYTPRHTGRDRGAGHVMADLRAAACLGTTAERAVAAARMVFRLFSSPPIDSFNYGSDQREYPLAVL